MFYLVQFVVNFLLFYMICTFMGIPDEYNSKLGAIMLICTSAGYLEGIIHANIKD